MKTLDILVGTVREAGLPVELTVEGERRELAPGVDLAAYRVVQEALTNALKYAGPARAWVSVRWSRDELELRWRTTGGRRQRRRRRPRARRHEGTRARCRRHARERPARRAAASSSRPASRSEAQHERERPRPDRRRPVARPRGFRMILDAETDIEVVGEAADGLEAVIAGRETMPGRDPDGRPHAERRRPRSHAAPARRQVRRPADPDPHHLRPRRIRLRGAARGRERLPAQGHAARAARGGDPRRRRRRCAARRRRSRGA